MSEWHEGLSDIRISELQNNMIPMWLLNSDTIKLFGTIPFADLMIGNAGRGWVSGARFDMTVEDDNVLRLRKDWKRAESTRWVDVRPELDEDKEWVVYIPDGVGTKISVAALDVISRLPNWILTRYEATRFDGVKQRWDCIKGGLLGRGYDNTPEVGINYGHPVPSTIELETVQPILVRFAKRRPGGACIAQDTESKL